MARQKRGNSSFLRLGCGCKDSKSVSASASTSTASQSSSSKSTTPTPTTRRPVRELSTSADTITVTSPSTTSYWEDEAAKLESSASTPSVSGLLRQLNELEQDVMSWGRCTPPPTDPNKHEESKKKRWAHKRSSGLQLVEESVAVVKETEDPLGDFKRSMLRMIVEKEIIDGEELSELLRRFIALNNPCHHDTILRAFAEIWDDVFAGYDKTPNQLLRRSYRRLPSPRHSNKQKQCILHSCSSLN